MDSPISTSPQTPTRDDKDIPSLIPTGFLHLAYFATEITLHRRIVRSLCPTPNPTSPTTPPQVDPYIQHICRSAAKTRLISAMDFVNRLTPAHLRAFWYFASKTNFALIGTFGSLLWATAPGREEAEFYRARLKEFRWTLGVSGTSTSMRAGGDGLRGVKGLTEFAIGMLDTSTGLLKGLPEKPVLSRRSSEIMPGGGLGSVPSGSSLASLGGYGPSSRMGGGGGAGTYSLPGGGFSFGAYMSGSAVGSLGSFGAGGANGLQSGEVTSEGNSGLASPSTSTSSGFEAYLAANPVGGVGANGDIAMSYDR